jgi:hypothetical protein
MQIPRIAASTRRVANPIAVRRYGVAGEPGREVVLTIGKPRASRGDWACSVLIEGIPKERRRRIYAVDAVQAMQLPMVYARHELDASGLRLTFLDGEPGDVGLPLPITDCWGLELQRKLERHMDREIKRLNEAVALFLKLKEARHAREQARRGEPSST